MGTCPGGGREGPQAQLRPQHNVLVLGRQFLVSAVPPKLQALCGALSTVPSPGGLGALGQIFSLDPPQGLALPVVAAPALVSSLLATAVTLSQRPSFPLVYAGGVGGPGETVSPFEARAAVDQMSRAGPSAGQGQGPRLTVFNSPRLCSVPGGPVVWPL